ncbi:hypothetical protein HY636_04160 [Candidatus Woesearchaeota archaeon]|nr:hypothetical protein [Candidatus Woesearchaeota archaeon]
MNITERQCLVENIRRLARTVNALESMPSGNLIFYGPSRHLVISSEDGKTIAKAYRDDERFNDEIANLDIFGQINKERSALLSEIAGREDVYIGLPKIDSQLLMQRTAVRPENGTLPILLLAAERGDLLYDKTIDGHATFQDYLTAAVQVARIQEEGKQERSPKFSLEDVVRDPAAKGMPVTDYFVRRRFEEVFLRQLSEHAGIDVPEHARENLVRDWESLVAQNLVKAHRSGLTGYYFDGNPKHHILGPDGKVVSFDFEFRLYVPALLGLASLLSFGLTRDGRQYLDTEEQTKVLDRFFIEMEFANALRKGYKDKAKQIFDYVTERKEVYASDLSGPKSEGFFRLIGKQGDMNEGREYRDKFLSAWPYAVLDRATAWIGHKARYKQVAQLLIDEGVLREQGIRFEREDPIEQNTIEQREHIQTILATLKFIQGLNGRNAPYLQDAARRLHYWFQELSAHTYFSRSHS